MALRIVIEHAGETRKKPLTDRGLIVGSGRRCDLRIAAPSVSRRHARLFLDGESAWIIDLGSRNGTAVGGTLIDEARRLKPGEEIVFGTIRGTIEVLADGDLDPAIELPTRTEVSAPANPTAAPTARVASAGHAFLVDAMPGLLGAAREGLTAIALAQRTGAALFSTLAAEELEIRDTSGGLDSLLFTAEREGDAESRHHEAVHPGDGMRLRATFRTEGAARNAEPALSAAADLLALRRREPEGAPATRPRRRAAPAPPDPPSLDEAVAEIYRQAARIARGDVSVLIRGESGTGKELLANYVHAASSRSDGPLVALNCAALPNDLLESELFGIEKGVATGVEARPGKLESADGGTLFLDEIGDMDLATQAKILRALQEGEVYRLGGSRPRPAGVRVVAATNRPLETLLADETFRTDLYHRVAGWSVTLPPLRHRRRDIANLAAHFLAEESERLGIRPAGVSRAALEALEAYGWPGNVRQLKAEIARAALFLEDGDLLDLGSLSDGVASAREDRPEGLKAVLEAAERQEIKSALDRTATVQEAAEILALPVSTLYRRMKALELRGEEKG